MTAAESIRMAGWSILALCGLVALAGQAPAAETSGKADAEATSKTITFTRDIAPIFQERCQECHRKGSMAPMSLVTYE
jgi:hypothetical protein